MIYRITLDIISVSHVPLTVAIVPQTRKERDSPKRHVTGYFCRAPGISSGRNTREIFHEIAGKKTEFFLEHISRFFYIMLPEFHVNKYNYFILIIILTRDNIYVNKYDYFILIIILTHNNLYVNYATEILRHLFYLQTITFLFIHYLGFSFVCKNMCTKEEDNYFCLMNCYQFYDDYYILRNIIKYQKLKINRKHVRKVCFNMNVIYT